MPAVAPVLDITRVSEWVIKFNGFLGTADSEVHIVQIIPKIDRLYNIAKWLPFLHEDMADLCNANAKELISVIDNIFNILFR